MRVPVDPSIVEGNCVLFKVGGKKAKKRERTERKRRTKATAVTLCLSSPLFFPLFYHIHFLPSPPLSSHQDIPRLGRVVTSAVTSVSSKAVTTADGASHPFDFLVLAPGVSYSDSLFKSDGGLSASSSGSTLEARRRQVTEAAELLEKAESVVVVGGGPVGVALAAEIADAADKNKNKKRQITLVTSADHLLHPKPSWVGAPAEAWLRSKGVRVVKGQKVEKVGEEEGGEEGKKKTKKTKGGAAGAATTLKTSPAGETLEADVVYW